MHVKAEHFEAVVVSHANWKDEQQSYWKRHGFEPHFAARGKLARQFSGLAWQSGNTYPITPFQQKETQAGHK